MQFHCRSWLNLKTFFFRRWWVLVGLKTIWKSALYLRSNGAGWWVIPRRKAKCVFEWLICRTEEKLEYQVEKQKSLDDPEGSSDGLVLARVPLSSPAVSDTGWLREEIEREKTTQREECGPLAQWHVFTKPRRNTRFRWCAAVSRTSAVALLLRFHGLSNTSTVPPRQRQKVSFPNKQYEYRERGTMI